MRKEGVELGKQCGHGIGELGKQCGHGIGELGHGIGELGHGIGGGLQRLAHPGASDQPSPLAGDLSTCSLASQSSRSTSCGQIHLGRQRSSVTSGRAPRRWINNVAVSFL